MQITKYNQIGYHRFPPVLRQNGSTGTSPSQTSGISQNFLINLDTFLVAVLLGTYESPILKYGICGLQHEKHRFRRNSYFSAVGYYLTISGLDELLVTSEVMGSGSLAGFLAGRHYNHCVRIHPLSFACLSKIRLAEFVNVQYNGNLPDIIKAELENISQSPETFDEALSDEESLLVKLLKGTMNRQEGETME